MTIQCDQLCPWNNFDKRCRKPIDEICPMLNLVSQKQPQTNADRIRAMSDEELAEIISKIAFDVYNCNEAQVEFVELLKTPNQCDDRCVNCILNWLKQPAEED